MAAGGSDKGGSELGEVLKPFYQRASEAEGRLSRLEAALAGKKDAGNEEILKRISELELKLEGANAELASEREKAQKLATENAKLRYRVSHLVRAVRELDAELASRTGGSEGLANTIPIKSLRL